MELSYSNIKKMDVVNVADGKHLGRVCDIVFELPENKILGFYVTGGKGLHIMRQDIFLPTFAIVKVGEDVILTDLRGCDKPKEDEQRRRRPQPCGNSPQQADSYGRPQTGGTLQNRRSYDEYE